MSKCGPVEKESVIQERYYFAGHNASFCFYHKLILTNEGMIVTVLVHTVQGPFGPNVCTTYLALLKIYVPL